LPISRTGGLKWPRLRFSELERLREVVVGTELKTGRLVVETVGRGEHQDRHAAAGRDDPLRDLVTARSRNVAVEHREVVRVHAQQFESSVAVARDVSGDRAEAQAITDGFRHEWLVLNDQHTQGVMLTSRRMSSAYGKPHTRW
jgi:hypothetical protein